MFIFCQNSYLALTYSEILKDFSPICFDNEEEIKKHIDETNFLVIDENLNLCSYLLNQKNTPAILFLSKHNPPLEEISFLKKPLTSQILFTKAATIKHQIENGLLLNFETNGFTFCGRKHTINDIVLTQKETKLVVFLYENKDRIVSREEILQNIFGYSEGTQTHTVETHIYKLRQKIGDSQGNLIQTQENGYCLNLR